MSTHDLLVEIAGYADIPPLPWAELRAGGNSLMQSDAYLSLLRQKHVAFTGVVATLDIPKEEWEDTIAVDLTDAWSDAYDRVSRFAGEYAAASRLGTAAVATKFALQLWEETLVRLIVLVDEVCIRNLEAHEQGLPRIAVAEGLMSEAEAEASASRTYQLWEAVITIDAAGYLAPLKRRAVPASGLGAALPPVAIVTIVVVVIAAIVLIILYGRQQAIEDEHWKTVCVDKAGNPRVPLPKGCADALGGGGIVADLARLFEGLGKATGGESIGKGIAVAVVAAALLYVGGVYVLPALMRQRAHA